MQPTGTQNLKGGTNINIQERWPGRPVDHGSILGDGAVFKLVLDALTHPGPAQAARVADLCSQAAIGEAPKDFGALADWMDGKITDHEPPIKRYAR